MTKREAAENLMNGVRALLIDHDFRRDWPEVSKIFGEYVADYDSAAPDEAVEETRTEFPNKPYDQEILGHALTPPQCMKDDDSWTTWYQRAGLIVAMRELTRAIKEGKR